MRLPWRPKAEIEEKEQEIGELEDRIEQLEEERDSWKERFEAEKERRSELSRKKQEAEEERNRLKEKLKQKPDSDDQEGDDGEDIEFRDLDFNEAENVIRKIGSIEAEKKELVTVYCPGEVQDLSDLKTLKNSVSRKHYSLLNDIEEFVAFIDSDLGVFILRMSPFFGEKVSIDDNFQVHDLLEFLNSEKHWCLFSAGETTIYREEEGDYEELDRVKSRVNREHKKGGFSQGRFERKRDQQIENHIEKTRDLLEDFSGVFVLGDRRLCEDLPGDYVGGFNPNQQKPQQFYGFGLHISM